MSQPEDRNELRRNYDVKIDVLSERVENWMETTTDYRKALCGKLDLVTDRLNQLQCPSHRGEIAAVKKDVDRLILGAWAIIAVLFVSGAAWGKLSHTVDVNTKKWANLEPEFRKAQQDIVIIKDKSYGYRDIPIK